jgi:hypothetical protein
MTTIVAISGLERIEDSFPGNSGGEIRADLIFLCPLVDLEATVEIVARGLGRP